MEELRSPSNLKVHFALAENRRAEIALSEHDVRYRLWSAYPYLARILRLKNAKKYEDIERVRSCPIFRPPKHSILDSGLFTLMFGAQKGCDARIIDRWYNELIDFIRGNQIKDTCVEVDCQKVIGVKEAWRYRIKMREDLPDNRQINVFHCEDGKDGLDELIRFSDYIAISVPEWRILKRSEAPRTVCRIVDYIKSKREDIDIHLLGCTQISILRHMKYCTSADSSSWGACIRWGRFAGSRHIRDVRDDVLQRTLSRLEPVFTEYDAYYKEPISSNCKINIAHLSLAITTVMPIYETFIGSQD